MITMIQGLLVYKEGTAYIVDKGLVNTVLIIIVCVLALFGLLAVNISNRTRAEHLAKETQIKLKESYEKLESTYEEVSSTQKELSTKYEELKRSEAKNRKLAYADYLTELPNRTAFTDKLDKELISLGENETLAIMYIDLDNFKNINDSLGHSYGDELIIDVSHRLREAIGEKDYLARFGGDEFIILTTDLGNDMGEYEDKVKRIQKVLAYPFVLAMKEFFVTLSIGIAFAPKDATTTQNLLKNVDSAMYVAKEMGKNTYCYYNESINHKLLEKIELQSEIRRASENNEFEVYYQAQVNLDSDKIVGFEALVRWNHPTKGLIVPAGFVSIAEETGLIVPIGKWVLKESCRQLKRWEDMGFKDINIAVNLSARQFMDEDIVQTVYDAINETKINPMHLELEITESIALGDMDYSIETIKKLKEIGVQFSLDDFGTGYSSMNYLKKLPVKNLKIDKSFMDTVMEDDSDQKIVSAIIKLAQILDLEVIAEGVEYNAQALFLKDINCNKAQGYLYSRPIPGKEAEKLMRKLKMNK